MEKNFAVVIPKLTYAQAYDAAKAIERCTGVEGYSDLNIRQYTENSKVAFVAGKYEPWVSEPPEVRAKREWLAQEIG